MFGDRGDFQSAEEKLKKLDAERDVREPTGRLPATDQGVCTPADGETFVDVGLQPAVPYRRSDRNNKGISPKRLPFNISCDEKFRKPRSTYTKNRGPYDDVNRPSVSES